MYACMMHASSSEYLWFVFVFWLLGCTYHWFVFVDQCLLERGSWCSTHTHTHNVEYCTCPGFVAKKKEKEDRPQPQREENTKILTFLSLRIYLHACMTMTFAGLHTLFPPIIPHPHPAIISNPHPKVPSPRMVGRGPSSYIVR